MNASVVAAPRAAQDRLPETALPSGPATAARPTPLPASPRAGWRWTLPGAAAAAALQACGGGGSDAGSAAASPASAASPAAAPAASGSAAAAPQPSAAAAAPAVNGPLTAVRTYAAAATDEEAARFLLQAQFSASDADIASVRSMGYANWLASQFATAPGIGAWDWLTQRGYDAIDGTTRYYDHRYQADYAAWMQLMTAPDAVRKRVALALSEIFSVSTNGIDMAWRSHIMASWFDMLSAHALGNFRQLIEAVTLHPAMGVYLNISGSQKENAAGRQPDENYARELMQLMTIGTSLLNADGTVQRGAGGQPLDSYTLSDVTNLARVFTGYKLDQSRNATVVEPTQGRTVGSTAFSRLPMVMDASRHSTMDVVFLGASIPGGTEPAAKRGRALDVLFNHANVGPFIGRQLIQRLVTSNPSPAYVARVAAAFADNGGGVRGDLAAVVAAVLLDDEARAPAGLSSPGFGRLREPMLRLVQWGRTFGLTSAYGSWKIGDLSDAATQLGQSPLRSPSIFNFFRPGYVPPGTAIAQAGGVAPEFQLVNESSVGGYLNFMQGVVRKGLYVNAPDVAASVAASSAKGYDLQASYTREKAIAHDAAALVARLNLLLAAGQLPSATVKTIVDALAATPLKSSDGDSAKLDRIAAGVLLVMASAGYLVQK